MGTAATESSLIFRRQKYYSMDNNAGAWGLWQSEEDAMIDNVKYLRRRSDVRRRTGEWLYGEYGDHDMVGIMSMGSHGLLRLVHSDDRFACAMARIHYLRWPLPVPSELYAKAGYYKKFYNSEKGKGSVEKYMEDWARLIAPELEKD